MEGSGGFGDGKAHVGVGNSRSDGSAARPTWRHKKRGTKNNANQGKTTKHRKSPKNNTTQEPNRFFSFFFLTNQHVG